MARFSSDSKACLLRHCSNSDLNANPLYCGVSLDITFCLYYPSFSSTILHASFSPDMLIRRVSDFCGGLYKISTLLLRIRSLAFFAQPCANSRPILLSRSGYAIRDMLFNLYDSDCRGCHFPISVFCLGGKRLFVRGCGFSAVRKTTHFIADTVLALSPSSTHGMLSIATWL